MQEHRISGRTDLNRALIDQLSDKWTIPVLNTICDGTLRFNQIRRLLSGISQKSLTECLRKLERDGIVERRVVEATPPGTEHSITDLGRTLQEP